MHLNPSALGRRTSAVVEGSSATEVFCRVIVSASKTTPIIWFSPIYCAREDSYRFNLSISRARLIMFLAISLKIKKCVGLSRYQ